jgi:DNA helicase II / ATP-dependent DNA helicase PcrA
MISKAKNSGDPNRYILLNGKIPRKAEIHRLYNERLEASNSVDFDDILLLTRDLLKRFPEIRNHYRESFQYILVDEFQDSNNIQNEVIDLLLSNGNLTVVGDDYQSIYQFRGADPSHFINFPQKYPGAMVFRLEENYRSTAQIVSSSDTLIACNSRRMEKSCFSRRDGRPIVVEGFADEQDEARWVAQKCRHITGKGTIAPEEIAVLFRTKFTSLPFERALRFARVPYEMVGAQGFFQRREVQDVNAYLVCAVNPRDDVSFERIINVPKRGIGPGALKKIAPIKKGDMSWQDACRQAVALKLLPKKASAALDELLTFLPTLAGEKPDSAIRRVIDEMHYEEHLRSFAESEEDLLSRMENVSEMIHDARQRETIADYLEEAALVRDDTNSEKDKDKHQGVKLSTIHAAKGLEFKVVFVVALEEGLLPHQRSLREVISEEDDEGLQEERRLMYVAMTRASDHLFLTWSMSRRGEMTIQSRFLQEMEG